MRAQKELGESGKNIHFWVEDASTPAGEFKNQKPKNVQLNYVSFAPDSKIGISLMYTQNV